MAYNAYVVVNKDFASTNIDKIVGVFTSEDAAFYVKDKLPNGLIITLLLDQLSPEFGEVASTVPKYLKDYLNEQMNANNKNIEEVINESMLKVIEKMIEELSKCIEVNEKPENAVAVVREYITGLKSGAEAYL